MLRPRSFGVAAVSLALAAVGLAAALRAFLPAGTGGANPQSVAESRSVETGRPAPVEPVVDVTLPIRWPSSVAYGEGSVWVAVSANDGTGAGTVYRFDPDTAEILAEISTPVVPGWETGGGAIEVVDGDVWVAGGGSSRNLVRIDPLSNRVVQELSVPGDFLGDVAVDERGVWVSVIKRDAIDVVRLNRDSGEEEARYSFDGFWAREILAVEGTLWLHERLTHGAVVGNSVLRRIDPDSGEILATVPLHGGATMVAEGDGFIWVPTWTSEGGNLLLRIDPQSGAVITMPSDNMEFVIAPGEGGIWGVARKGQDLFSERSGIVRFDPVTGRVDAGVGVDGGPIALAVAPGSVWVVHYKEGVTRIDLRSKG